ncbi:LytR/AlgR family response regulator transcription factor [Gynurincola endophyticus]|uniref:LytR/AlgR family response regulator transcription factor n=1 Tax=Gynurincola endophyticus TaxID=2479004 RepID=UPI001F16099B|nr:LytTR family DNA-binding domain-containing protein [Gynurincola endophyticus]
MIHAIAIDDEPFALEVIKSLSEKVPFLKMEAYFTDAFQALEYLRSKPVDLVFLDIKMPDITGIEWLKSLPDPPMIIFTTAYSEHAVESFELNALDYLLKPFSLARFLKAANKAEEMKSMKSYRTEIGSTQFLFVKSGTEQIKLLLSEILYVQSAGNYVHFIDKDKKITTRLTMGEVEELLPLPQFTRVHRSYIIADHAVRKIDKNFIYVADEQIPIGTAYLQIVEKKFFS